MCGFFRKVTLNAGIFQPLDFFICVFLYKARLPQKGADGLKSGFEKRKY